MSVLYARIKVENDHRYKRKKPLSRTLNERPDLALYIVTFKASWRRENAEFFGIVNGLLRLATNLRFLQIDAPHIVASYHEPAPIPHRAHFLRAQKHARLQKVTIDYEGLN